MPEFLELLDPHKALGMFLERIPLSYPDEVVQTEDSLGRVTSSPVIAPHPLPTFSRSTVDGFAVIASDTFGAGEALPAYLSLVGEVPMGSTPTFSVSASECALIHTGGMLPTGSDAVVMLEYTQRTRPQEVEILRTVAKGENVIKLGEDVATGEEIIPSHTRLRAPEIGGLMALGFTQISVVRKPRIAIISSGDEIVSPTTELSPGRVRDVNSYTLSALVEEAGGVAVRYGIVPDQMDMLFEKSFKAIQECDALVITAGSSASTRDLTAQVIGQLGEPGVLVHGVNVRPGKPTILAVCKDRAVIGLPGNPVSALVIAGLFLVPLVRVLLGLGQTRFHPSIKAQLNNNISSQAGREDWVAVRLIKEENDFWAEPVFGKSNLIFTLVRANGLIRISPDATGLNAGEKVDVFLI
jgi:molybdopterin molybdotransferase